MANTKISDLTAGAAVAATDVIPNVQTAGAGPVKTTAAQIKTFTSASPTLVTPTIGVAAGTSLALTPGAGATALTLTGGTQTTSFPVIDAVQTWNGAAVVFTGIKLNVTDTTSSSLSMLIDLQVAGASKFNVNRAGLGTFANGIDASGGSVQRIGAAIFGVSADTILTRDGAANILAMKNVANVQEFRVYKTTTGPVYKFLKGDNNLMGISGAAFTDGAAAQVGTLTNAPTAGNPTKWIPVDDNGTTRYIPAW